MIARYDVIGVDYAELREPDPRIAAAIEAAIGPVTGGFVVRPDTRRRRYDGFVAAGARKTR